MPKPLALRKEQRRAARRLARDMIVRSLREAETHAASVPPVARAAFLDEIGRTLAFVSRTRAPAYNPSVAREDSAASDEADR